MAQQPRWTDERTEQLAQFVGNESPVSQETVKAAAEELGNSTRSISSKLRKAGYEVEPATQSVSRFSEEQENALRSIVEENSGDYTYAELAEAFEGGSFSPKVIQGKILSMELTQHIKPAPQKESTRTYTDEEEAKVRSGAQNGDFLEDIAESVGKAVASVRGKCLSLLRNGDIESIPKLRQSKAADNTDALAGINVSEMTVKQIAEATDKSERGVKSMLTRRGLTAVDHDGAAKKAKREAVAE